MALVYPLIRSSDINGSCFGNFLSLNYGHLVSPEGNEIVFQDIRENAVSQPVRARLSLQGTIHQILTIPAVSLPNNPLGLDGLLIYSRYTSESSSVPVKDIIVIYQFNNTSLQLETIQEFTFPVPKQSFTALNKAIISLRDQQGNDACSVVFYNGSNEEFYVIDLTSGLKAIPLTKFKSCKDSLSKIYWVNKSTIVTVTETNFTSTLELHDLNKKPPKGKQPQTLTKSVPEIVKFVGAGPSEKTILVMSSRRFLILKQTNKELKDGKEYQLEIEGGNRNWYHLASTSDGDSFFISSQQEVLLLRRSGAPIQLKVQEGTAGPIIPVGSSVFLLKNGEYSYFCRFRLNRKRTNIFADFIGRRELPSDDLELIGEHSSNGKERTLWWKHSKCPNDGLVVSETVYNVMSSPIASPHDGSISNLWKTSSPEQEECFLVSIGEKSDLLMYDGGELKCVTQNSWQNLHEKTVCANEKVQITPSKMFWESCESTVLSEPCFLAACCGSTCVAAGSEKAFIYKNAGLVKELKIPDTIIDLVCTNNKVGVLAAENVYILDVVSGELQKLPLSYFCSSLAIMPCGEIYVATPRGSIHCLTTNESSELPGTSIKKLTVIDNKLVVIDSSGKSFLSTKRGAFRKMDCSLKDEMVPFVGSTKFITVYDKVAHVLEFNSKERLKYKSLYLNSFPFAESIKIIDDALIALQWGEQEVLTMNLNNSRDYQKHTINRIQNDQESTAQIFVLDRSHVLVVESTVPADPMDSDLEDEEEDDPSYYQVPLTVGLYELDLECTELRLTAELSVTLPGDPFDEAIVKFAPDSEGHNLYIFTQAMSSVLIHVETSSNTIESRQVRDHHGIVYYDHWFRGSRDSVMIVTQDGRVVESTHPLSVDDKRDDDIGTLREYDTDMIYDVIELTSRLSQNRRMFAASVKRNPGEKECRVVVFSYDGNKVDRIATLHIPSRRISLVESRSFAVEENKSHLLSPAFYIGCCDGALYAVTDIADGKQLRSLQEVQQLLLQEMGFGERAEKLSTSIDGSLIQAALLTPEVHDIILEKLGSLVPIAQAMEGMHL